MEILACEKCNTIIAPYERSSILMPLPQHKYMLAGKVCGCGHEILVRRWTHEYVLKEDECSKSASISSDTDED